MRENDDDDDDDGNDDDDDGNDDDDDDDDGDDKHDPISSCLLFLPCLEFNLGVNTHYMMAYSRK